MFIRLWKNYKRYNLGLSIDKGNQEKEFQEILQNPVAIIKYNQYSVIKRKNGGKAMKKIPEKFLPIGTVVMLKGGTKRVMIAVQMKTKKKRNLKKV